MDARNIAGGEPPEGKDLLKPSIRAHTTGILADGLVGLLSEARLEGAVGLVSALEAAIVASDLNAIREAILEFRFLSPSRTNGLILILAATSGAGAETVDQQVSDLLVPYGSPARQGREQMPALWRSRGSTLASPEVLENASLPATPEAARPTVDLTKGSMTTNASGLTKPDQPRRTQIGDHQPAARPLVQEPAVELDSGPTVALVTALSEEFAAMHVLVDDPVRRQVEYDWASYVAATMPSARVDEPHRVLLTLLPETGNDAAAYFGANLIRDFPTVTEVIMVGIAAGVPDVEHPYRHVRLGDIVVATRGIVDYDHVVDSMQGMTLRQGFPSPSPRLVAVSKLLDAMQLRGERPWEDYLDQALDTLSDFTRPPAETDRLHSAATGQEYAHPDLASSGHRPGRPKVHYGRIGSADKAMRNGTRRDELAARYQIRAIDMEGKGLGRAAYFSNRPWFLVRGISDYGDSDLKTQWRRYASLGAAAYVRALLAHCPPIHAS